MGCAKRCQEALVRWSAVPWHRFGQSVDGSAHSKEVPQACGD